MNQRLALAPAWSIVLLLFAAGTSFGADEGRERPRFEPDKDLLSLHYDHAPDKDDGHSAAADRTVLQSLHGLDWIKRHVVAVSGAYGENARTFNSRSDAVMDAAWNAGGGWLAAHENWDKAVARLVDRWSATLRNGGDVWVKEGGQSDITADAVRQIRAKLPDIDTTQRIHVVQHSRWNERQTTDEALEYTRQATGYIKIRDANAYLNVKGGRDSFERAAREHPIYGPAWRAAFKYYDPSHRLDFSDTGELLYILDLGKLDLDAFRQRFLTTPESP